MRWFGFDLGSLRRVTFGAACLVMLAACSSGPDLIRGPDPLANASRISTVPPTLGAADCDPPSPMHRLRSATEIRAATSDGATIWAHLAGEAPFTSGEPIDVAWRVNGHRALSLVLVDSKGVETPVDEVVPDRSVRWVRPGDPWRSTLQFDHPGCWRINVTRGNRTGDIWIEIA